MSEPVNSCPTPEEIALRAYEIFIESGCVPGRDDENWLQAEAELRARSSLGQTGQTVLDALRGETQG